MKKRLVTLGAIGTLSIAGLVAPAIVSAATDTSSTDPMSSLVDKIASKFNLNKSDVQVVFDQERSAREAERAQAYADKLAQGVKDGKITQAQADQLIAKQKELKTLMDSLKDKTETERRAAMKAKMDEFKKWVEDNNIPQEFAHPGGHGGPGGHGPRD